MWQSTENNKMRGTSQLGFLDLVLVAVMIVLNAVLWNALDLCAVGPAVGDRRSRSIRSPSSRLQCQRRNGAWFNSASVHVAASRAAFVPQHVLIQIGGKSKFRSSKSSLCTPETLVKPQSFSGKKLESLFRVSVSMSC